MKKNKYIVMGLFIIVIILYLIFRSIFNSTATVPTVQFESKDIKSIKINPINSNVKDITIDDVSQIERFTEFFNSLRYKELDTDKLFCDQIPPITIYVTYKDGTYDNLCLYQAWSRGLFNRKVGDAYILIGYNGTPFGCVSCSYKEFEVYVNDF